MNLLGKLPKGISRTFGKLWMKTKKTSPEICVIGGLVCGAGALVLVGMKTWKHKEKLQNDAKEARSYTTTFVDISEEDKKQLKKSELKKIVVKEDGTEQLPVKVHTDYNSLNEEEKQKFIARKIDFAKDICKVYWMPIALEFASGFLIWKGRSILRKDLSAMTAAYAAMAEAYRKYREGVAQKYGKQADEELVVGYTKEDVIDENGNVETVYKPEKNGNLNPYGFWFNAGYFDNDSGEWIWRNDVWAGRQNDKNALLWTVKNEQEQATRELRTIGYWRLETSMIRLGQPPKEAAKFHNIGKVYKDGEENRVSFGVLEDNDQLEVNKGFTSSFHSQNICYINPNVDGYIGYINDELEKYDYRYGRAAKKDLPYKSYNREANRLIQRYNKESMERLIFDNLSDTGKRKMAKII